MCADCVLSNGLAAEPVLECLLIAAFAYLAAGTDYSTEITELISEILFSEVCFFFRLLVFSDFTASLVG